MHALTPQPGLVLAVRLGGVDHVVAVIEPMRHQPLHQVGRMLAVAVHEQHGAEAGVVEPGHAARLPCRNCATATPPGRRVPRPAGRAPRRASHRGCRRRHRPPRQQGRGWRATGRATSISRACSADRLFASLNIGTTMDRPASERARGRDDTPVELARLATLGAMFLALRADFPLLGQIHSATGRPCRAGLRCHDEAGSAARPGHAKRAA